MAVSGLCQVSRVIAGGRIELVTECHIASQLHLHISFAFH